MAPKEDADFVAGMEKILDLYQEPINIDEPLVTMDELSKQLTKEVRAPLAPQIGSCEKYDFEYERNGTANIFMLYAPHTNWRDVKVTNQRTAKDWAELMHDLVYVHFPKAKKIKLVMDNLNTHKLGSLYKAYEPAVARHIASKLDIYYTPVHGSWLNIAEIELSVLSRQCINGRIGTKEMLIEETDFWKNKRNNSNAKINWKFNSPNARVKLKKLYPVLQ